MPRLGDTSSPGAPAGQGVLDMRAALLVTESMCPPAVIAAWLLPHVGTVWAPHGQAAHCFQGNGSICWLCFFLLFPTLQFRSVFAFDIPSAPFSLRHRDTTQWVGIPSACPGAGECQAGAQPRKANSKHHPAGRQKKLRAAFRDDRLSETEFKNHMNTSLYDKVQWLKCFQQVIFHSF